MTRPTITGRPRINRTDVIEAAEQIVDRLGWDGLTMTDLAATLGVKAPSLYTHVRGLDDVLAEIQVRTMSSLASLLRHSATGRSGEDAFRALAAALHTFAADHPRRYEGITRAVIDREALFDAASGASDVLGAVLRSYGIESNGSFAPQLAAFAALHGVVALEISGFFGADLDAEAVYALVLEGALHALASAGTSPSTEHAPGDTHDDHRH